MILGRISLQIIHCAKQQMWHMNLQMSFTAFENYKPIKLKVVIHFTGFGTNAMAVLSCDLCLLAMANNFNKKNK